MPCFNCGSSETIKAHLLPRAFTMEVKLNRGEQHLILHQKIEKLKVSHTGIYDPNILCAKCDGILGEYENYVYQKLKECRELKASSGQIIEAHVIDGDKLIRFAAGIAWKYSVASEEHGRIKLGPYQAQLCKIIFEKELIPPSVDLAIFRLYELDGDVYFYRAPLYDRKDERNIIRFSVGSFVFFLKLDKRANSKVLPSEHWIRGKETFTIPIIDATLFEEGRMHRELAMQPNVRHFFEKMKGLS